MLNDLWSDPAIQAAVKGMLLALLPLATAIAYFVARRLGLDVSQRKDAQAQNNAELAALFVEEVKARLKDQAAAAAKAAAVALVPQALPSPLSPDELERIAVEKFRELQPKTLGLFRPGPKRATERVVAALPTLGIGAAAKARAGASDPKAPPRS